MRLVSAKPAVQARPHTGIEATGKKKRIVQSAFPAQMRLGTPQANQRPISNNRQEYEQEIDEIFEESEILGS